MGAFDDLQFRLRGGSLGFVGRRPAICFLPTPCLGDAQPVGPNLLRRGRVGLFQIEGDAVPRHLRSPMFYRANTQAWASWFPPLVVDICRRRSDGYGGEPVLQIGQGMPAPPHSPPLFSRWLCGAAGWSWQSHPVLAHRSQSNFILARLSLRSASIMETHRGNNRHGRKRVEAGSHAPVDNQATCRRLCCFQAPRLARRCKMRFCGANGHEVEKLIAGGVRSPVAIQ